MKLIAGSKLKSTVCSAEVIVIRPPGEEAVLACGGESMTPPGEAATAPPLAAPAGNPPLIGKRYVDTPSGLEVLCTKGGKGELCFAGRALSLKEAKPLPASD